MIPPAFIQDLLNRVDIVEVIGRYVKLKKGGANFIGLCPFHNEKSPSFTVSATKQFYHCFGCGAHGTAVGFLMEYAGTPFPEVVRELAQSVGMVVPLDDQRMAPEQRAQYTARSAALTDTLATAMDYYRRELRGSPRAIGYLKARGLTGEVAGRFGLGYAPSQWQNLAAAFDDYQDTALVEAGLVIEREEEGGPRKHYDRFRDRVMFPIRNTKGQVIGFGGRIIDAGEPKYLNSPETPVFSKGNELYGLFEARQAIRDAGFAIVVEGYMDVVALAQHGVANAVATLGTACTATHVQKLIRQTDRIVFSFDGDAAGRRAAWRALEASLPHAADNRAFLFLFLPAEHDPDTFIREHGQDAFLAEARGAMPLSAFLLREVTIENDLATAEGRAKAAFEATPLLQALPPGGLRQQILRELARLTQSTEDELMALAQVAPLSRRRKTPAKSKRSAPSTLLNQIMRILLAHPKMVHEIDDAGRAALEAEPAAALHELLEACAAGGAAPTLGAISDALLRGPEADAFSALLKQIVAAPDMEENAALSELRAALLKLRLSHIKDQLGELTASGLSDPQTATAIRALMETQKTLRHLQDHALLVPTAPSSADPHRTA